MDKVVKLILICQIKDDIIPQLMPLMWINSTIIWLILLFTLINLYNLNEEFSLKRMEGDKNYCEVKILW